jgi:predicted Zn-dependent protease
MSKPILVLVLAIGLRLSAPQVSAANPPADRQIDELQFGNYADRLFVATRVLLSNETVTRELTGILRRVSSVSKVPNIPFTVRVVNDATVNAYSGAGGFVYLNTGLLDVLGGKDEVAAVLAHEVAHVANSHQIKMLRKEYRIRAVAADLVDVAAIAAGFFAGQAVALSVSSQGSYAAYKLSSAADKTAATVVGILGQPVAATMAAAVANGYAREQELESDAEAVGLLHKAGYDPWAMVRVFSKLRSMRDSLGINRQSYTSSLINAEPGLNERLKKTEQVLTDIKQ